MGYLRKDQLVTVEDLEIMKVEILSCMRQLLADSSERPFKKWLKAAEARKILGFSPGTLQVVRDSGKISYSKIGGIFIMTGMSCWHYLRRTRLLKS